MHANEFKYFDDEAAVLLRWIEKKCRINECTNAENDDERKMTKVIKKNSTKMQIATRWL